MKKRSKILASLVLAGTMVLGLAGCGDSGSANGGTQSGKNSDAKYQVGIVLNGDMPMAHAPSRCPISIEPIPALTVSPM